MSSSTAKQIDLATILGVMAGFGLVFYAIYHSGNIHTFLSFEAALIVFGGTLGATLINHSLGDFGRTLTLLRTAFFPNRQFTLDRIRRIVHYARRLRAEPLEVVQDEFFDESDSFFRSSLQLLADKVDENEIRKVMSIELTFLEDRHRRGAQMFQTMGTIAPAMGLVGTLIGLIQMLQNLENPTQIGPAMAISLVTTFYGAILANLVCLPIAGKLRARSEDEFLLKELTIEGVRGLAQGLNPRTIERRLLGFLAPEQRTSEYE